MVKQWPAHKTMWQSAHTNRPLFGHVRSGFGVPVVLERNAELWITFQNYRHPDSPGRSNCFIWTTPR